VLTEEERSGELDIAKMSATLIRGNCYFSDTQTACFSGYYYCLEIALEASAYFSRN